MPLPETAGTVALARMNVPKRRSICPHALSHPSRSRSPAGAAEVPPLDEKQQSASLRPSGYAAPSAREAVDYGLTDQIAELRELRRTPYGFGGSCSSQRPDLRLSRGSES